MKLRRAGLIFAMAIALICPALASSGETVEPLADDLLRQAIANENIGAREDYRAWMDRLQKPRGSVTKLMVNTPQGILSRTVAFNDRALTPEERQQDDERINRLLNPAMMLDKARKQHEDQQHVERLLLALPMPFGASTAPCMTIATCAWSVRRIRISPLRITNHRCCRG